MSNKRKTQSGKKKIPMKRKRKPEGKAAVLADYREFKQRFHKWVDDIQIHWPDGKPMEPGSNYQFVLPQAMVDFIISLVQKSHVEPKPVKVSDDEAERQRLEQVKELSEVLASGVNEKLDAAKSDTDEDAEDDGGSVKDRRTFRGSLNENQTSKDDESGSPGSGPGTETESQESETGQEGSEDADGEAAGDAGTG